MRKKLIGLLLATICTGTILTGCGSVKSSDTLDDRYITYTGESSYDIGYDDDACEEYYEEELNYSSGTGYAPNGSQGTDVTDSGALANDTATNRKMITTVSMNVETEAFDELTATVESKVKELGGYLESYDKGSNYYRGSGVSLQYADMTIRVPADRLDVLLDSVQGTANVVNMTSSTEDVTLTYVDIQSRKESLQVEYSCLLELLAEAESVDQIIVLQNRLTEVRYQIESMESQLRTYDNRVNYSTVYLYISEVEHVTPVITKEETTGEKIKSGLSENMYTIGKWFKNFFIGFVIFLPYLGVIAIVVVITLLAVFIPLKIGKKKREKKVQEWQKRQEMLLQQAQKQETEQSTNQDSQL